MSDHKPLNRRKTESIPAPAESRESPCAVTRWNELVTVPLLNDGLIHSRRLAICPG